MDAPDPPQKDYGSSRSPRGFARAIALGLLLCLVTFPAAVPAVPLIKVKVRIEALHVQAQQQISVGNFSGAARTVKQMDGLVKNYPGVYSDYATGNNLKSLHSYLSTVPKDARKPDVLQSYMGRTKEIDSLTAHSVALRRADKEPKPPYRQLADIASKWATVIPKIMVAPPEVMEYGAAMRRGLKAPDEVLHQELMRRISTGDLKTAQLIERWTNTPKEKRVFVTAARSDEWRVQSLKALYGPEGYELFFYTDCVPLCEHETVAAFGRTADTRLDVLSPAAAESLHTQVERLRLDERLILLIDQRTVDSVKEAAIATSEKATDVGERAAMAIRIDCLPSWSVLEAPCLKRGTYKGGGVQLH